MESALNDAGQQRMTTEDDRVLGDDRHQGREPVWRAEDATYAYPDGTLALRDLNVHVNRGEIVAVVGPSGCGKTTLLRLVASLLEPTGGRVAWGDEANRSQRKDGTQLSVVFQRDTVLPWLTVEQNVAFGLKYLEMTKAERKERVAELLEIVDLSPASKKYPYQLSGGMRRRVAFLMSVAVRPDMLLLDEPFSSLDEPTRIALHGEVLKTVRREGMTVLLVTHDLGEAVSLSDRIYVLTKGPGHVAAEHKVELGADRDVMQLRETDEYASAYRDVWHDLRTQILAASTKTGTNNDG